MRYLVHIICLGASGIFLIYQEIAIANLRDEIKSLVSEAPDTSESRPKQSSKPSWEGFFPNWKLTTPQENPGSLLKQRAFIAARDRNELLAGFDYLPSLNMDEDLENEIRLSLLEILAPLDPATTLTHADALSDQNSPKLLDFKLNTFRYLTQEDSAKANA